MADFNVAAQKTLKVEGGLSNVKQDRGGLTNWGITEGTARANGFTRPMAEMTQAEALAIYKSQYWDIMGLDRVSSQLVADELFDSGINCGTAKPGVWVQKSINAVSYGQKWPWIKDDGVIGNTTLYYLNAALAAGFETMIYNLLNSYQTVFYSEICQADPTQTIFFAGWVNHRVRFKVV